MKRNHLFMATAITIIAASASSCGTSKTVPVNSAGVVKTETLSQTEGAIQKVLFGSWTALSVGSESVTGIDRPYIEFGENPANPFLVKCYAYDGCNYINGEYAVTPGGSIKPAADNVSTMRMCPDARYEMGFGLALKNMSSYKIEKVGLDYILYLKNAAGTDLLTLRKFENDFLNGAWAVKSIQGTSVDSNLNLILVIDLNEHSIHGDVGCNTLNGTIVVNPDVQNSISFTDMATTRMTCPAIATEQALLEALRSVVSLRPAGSDDTALLLNAQGSEAVALQRVDLK